MAAVSVLAWGPAAAQTPVPCGEAFLRAAIDGASTGAILLLPDGCTIRLTGAAGEENNQTGDLDVNVNTAATSLTIQGAGPGRTTIDGSGIDRVIDIFAGKSLTLRYLTIRNGMTRRSSPGKPAGSTTRATPSRSRTSRSSETSGPKGAASSPGVSSP